MDVESAVLTTSAAATVAGDAVVHDRIDDKRNIFELGTFLNTSRWTVGRVT